MVHVQSYLALHHSETQTMQTHNSPKRAGNYNKWNDSQHLWMLEQATNHLDYWLDGSYTHIARYTRLFTLLPLNVFPHKALQNVTAVESQWKSMLKKYATAVERLNSSGEGLRADMAPEP